MTKTAVVIGGSIAGLLAACAAAEAFDEVVVLERSDTPVPQGAHAHGLLAGGLEALDTLLPGLAEELERSGCPTGDNLRDAAWIFGGLRLAIGDSGVRGMTLGRPLLETTIRDRVGRLPNVRIVTNARCHGLVVMGDDQIAGVRATIDGMEQLLAADLVVDASGRSSKLPAWLVELGFAAPPIDEIALDTHYVTRVYARRPQHLAGGIAVVVVSDPRAPRGGIAVALDDRRWLVSQYAMGGPRPPKDHAGFVAFSQTLAGPQLTELLDEPLDEDAATLRFPSSIRRRYERSRGLPDNVIAIGDAMASFNPTFGQGITVAAKQAVVVRELGARLAQRGGGREFFARAARIRDVAWDAAAGRLLTYPGVVGRPTLKMRLAQRYLPRVIARAHDDVGVASALLAVMQFFAPPESLFAWRVLRRVFGRPRGRARSALAGARA